MAKEKKEKKVKPATENKYLIMIKENPRRMFIMGMVLLLLVRLLVYFSEASYTKSELPVPPVWSPKPIVDTASPEYAKVKSLLVKMPEFEKANLIVLTKQNMFDPKTVNDAQELEKQANERVMKGYAAFAAGKMDEALEQGNGGLAIIPNHTAAKELIKKIAMKKVEDGTKIYDEAIKNNDNEKLAEVRKLGKQAIQISPKLEEANSLLKKVDEKLGPEQKEEEQPGQ